MKDSQYKKKHQKNHKKNIQQPSRPPREIQGKQGSNIAGLQGKNHKKGKHPQKGTNVFDHRKHIEHPKKHPQKKKQQIAKKIEQPEKVVVTPTQPEKKEIQQIIVPSDRLGGFHKIVRRYEADLILILIPLTLLFMLFILTTLNNNELRKIAATRLNPAESIEKMNPYPFAQNTPLLNLSAKGAIIIDADSQVVLFSKNPQLRFSMASTTKIMTALTALDYFKSDAILTVRSAGVGGAVLGLVPGERLTFESLLYAMLLPSANDAAVAIADNYPGGREAFIKRMNEKARSLHLSNTHFADPTGLDDDENYTTVEDLARLASYAIKNPDLSKATSTKQKVIASLGSSKRYELNNLNKLLGTNGVTGIKTGTTEGAGEVLVTSTVENGHTFIIVVMNSTNRFADTRMLLSFISQNIRFVSPLSNLKE